MSNFKGGNGGTERMKDFTQYIVYLFFRLFLALFRWFPMRLFYVLSDLTFFILYKAIKYRRAITYDNLRKCFPEKDDGWIESTACKFYHNLSDILVESLKGFSLSQKELSSRFKLANPEVFYEIEQKYPEIIVASAHCGNWEWGALLIPLLLKYHTYGIYKPLSNRFIDDYLKKHRALWGMHLVSVTQTGFMFRNSAERRAYFFLSDQYPGKGRKVVEVVFLGRPTLWLGGVEKYARRFRIPVYYFGIRRLERGRYEVFAEQISSNPHQSEFGEITRNYVRILEQEILNHPDNWLWSHRRWKNLAE